MIVAGEYSFNNGQAVVENMFSEELAEIKKCILAVDRELHKTKISREKTMPGKELYSPSSLNDDFKLEFKKFGWSNYKVPCEYSDEYYTPEYKNTSLPVSAYRDMDFVKNRLGVEVQFGKYAFMVYNVCAKMTIFNRLGIIEAGVEIVPVKELAGEMSTGVSYFEQFIWDLEHRGVSDIDIPVLILGIA